MRAGDGTLWGPWNSDVGGGSCEFVYDSEAPAKPTVSSPEYPDDHGMWHDGVGVYGTFTVDSASDDTVSYRYDFLGGPRQTAVPNEPGGPVVLRRLPRSAARSKVARARARTGTVRSPTYGCGTGSSPPRRWGRRSGPP
ncbi:MAG: hypothetical protein JF621_24300 [Streptomyces turgidiscabies]|nr:hypothetical protein [Streptomyces turgidiscabies]